MTQSAVVIGAGPYGLSTAAHLKGRGIPVRIFGTPMSSWRETMPTGMILKSTPKASTISAPRPGHTLQDFCDATGERRLVTERDLVTLEAFVRYGRWFQERLVPEVEQVQVVSVDDGRNGGFELKLDSGEELSARTVVVASGLSSFAHIPAGLTGGPVSHSSRHADFGRFAGREVVVIGAGQSALESAVLLRDAGASVRVVARRAGSVGFGAPPTSGFQWKPDSPVGRAWSLYAFSDVPGPAAFRFLPRATRLWLVRNVLGPRGAWWLAPRFTGIPVMQGCEVDACREVPGAVVLVTRDAQGRVGEIEADHVIAATGYRVDLETLGFLSPQVRARLARVGGSPRLDAGFESSVRGLYFTGLAAAATFGPVLRFVCGAGFASRRIASRLR
ncbi:NAD(P)-binding domain-containing protein [Streptomyces sp. RB6PN25]|uniref:NAD(P)-binding domain-containing protein n=1 Tax=Streptomyces humicola TaxID=2953240 RepID=A0ABT1PVX0_9ACTN|nr:NAD(P)-binding domain-containing protein [Streptomyces humicola]MCQ4081278.1 NAD(P)-binding domain-containing protein [Streptomyces humicola]